MVGTDGRGGDFRLGIRDRSDLGSIADDVFHYRGRSRPLEIRFVKSRSSGWLYWVSEAKWVGSALTAMVLAQLRTTVIAELPGD